VDEGREALSHHSASTESGPYRMEKHEGDTASQEVLEQQVTAIIGLSV